MVLEWPDILRCSRCSSRVLHCSWWIPVAPENPKVLQGILDGFGGSQNGLEVPRQTWRCLDVWWVCLGSSRMFGHRHVLAGQSYRCWVGIAHSGSRIEVVMIREELGGQGILCIEV